MKADPILLHAYICGSVSRLEALPMSDFDVVYFGPRRVIGSMEVDEIDRIDNFALTDPVAERLFACMSPEAGFLDSRPLDGEPHKYYELHNGRQAILNRFLWEYTYSRSFNERSSDAGYNLKYSVGAYRDILLFNWFARTIDNSLSHEKPEILESIDKIASVMKISSDDKCSLLESIAFIMLTKSAVLSAHSLTSTRGRTSLNAETLKVTMRADRFFANAIDNNEKIFWREYLRSKEQIGNFLNQLFDYALRTHGSLVYDYITLALRLSKGGEPESIKSLLADNQSAMFPVMACILFDQRLSASLLMEIAGRCSGDPGHYYTNRLIAKSPIADNAILRFLLNKSRFSIDYSTNERYRALINERLTNHE